MIHHCYQKVKKNYDVYDRVCSKHGHAPEPREVLDAFQVEARQVDQAKRSPEQGL